MREIKLQRVYGKKIAILGDFGFLISLAVLSLANDKPSEMPSHTIWVVLVVFVALLFFFVVTLQVFRYSFVRLTESGVWQWQLFSFVFIPWSEVQKVETYLGMRTIRLDNKMIIIQFEDFKEPDKLVIEIKKRVPESAFETTRTE
jgi:membrane protein YdbS with pleckstrin-like domain